MLPQHFDRPSKYDSVLSGLKSDKHLKILLFESEEVLETHGCSPLVLGFSVRTC